MGALLFDSTDTVKATGVATALANVPTAAWTCAFLVKRTAVGTDFDALGYLLSSTGNGVTEVGLSFRNDNKFMADIPGTGATSVDALASTTETYIVVISRPAGTNQPQICSYYTKSTNTWVHHPSAGTVSNGTAATMLELGAWEHTADFMRGYIGLAGWWAVELTQAQKQELSANWRTSDWWNNTGGQPKALIQGNTATPTDLAGNATTWTYTGVTLDAGETLVSFNFDGTGAAAATIPDLAMAPRIAA